MLAATLFLLGIPSLHEEFLAWLSSQPWIHFLLYTTAGRQPLQLLASSLNPRVLQTGNNIVYRPLTVFMTSPYSNGGLYSSSRHATPYHIHKVCHSGILPIGTPNPDCSTLVACLTSYSKNLFNHCQHGKE